MLKKILFYLALLVSVSTLAQTKTVIIDADTGNEVDDLYAIVRGLIEPDWNVVSLNATQWQVSHWSVEHSMEESHRLNVVLLSYLKMNDQVRASRGAEARLFDWGNKEQVSDAAWQIVQEAHKLPEGEKLYIATLGALTNVASAILMDKSIIPKIKVYWLGTSYNFEEDILKKTDFNSVMDIQAVDVVFNSKVELHVIPGNVAAAMQFSFQETKDRLYATHPLTDFLVDRWYNHKGSGVYTRVLWDLGLIEAMIHPDKVEEVKIHTSKENGNREVWYYKEIDPDFFREEFYNKTLEFVKQLEQ